MLFQMTQKQKNWLIRLNTDHTHFVFVDDSNAENLGSELKLRARFETFIYGKGLEDRTQNIPSETNPKPNTSCKPCNNHSHNIGTKYPFSHSRGTE